MVISTIKGNGFFWRLHSYFGEFGRFMGKLCEKEKHPFVAERLPNSNSNGLHFISCPEQLNRWPCPLVGLLVGPPPLTIRVFRTLQSDPRDLWPLRHLIKMMRIHDLTNTKTMTKTNTNTNTMTETNIFRELHQRAILETCDLWDIWSEWWGDMTWPTKRQWQRQRQRYFENTS